MNYTLKLIHSDFSYLEHRHKDFNKITKGLIQFIGKKIHYIINAVGIIYKYIRRSSASSYEGKIQSKTTNATDILFLVITLLRHEAAEYCAQGGALLRSPCRKTAAFKLSIQSHRTGTLVA